MSPEDDIELLKCEDKAILKLMEERPRKEKDSIDSNQISSWNFSRFDFGQWKHTIAGAGAGCTAAFITCPLDVVKTRLQNQGANPLIRPIYHGTFYTLRRIYLEEGIRGSFRGLAPTLLGYLPSWAIYFSTYHRFKDLLSENIYNNPHSPFVHMISAMAAGATSTISTNPLWVVKTRLMTQGMQSNYHYRNTCHALYMLFRLEGFKGFYRGLAPSLLGILHVAIQFPLYEHFRRLLIPPTSELKKEFDTLKIFIASTCSKIIATSFTYPHEVIRTRIQTQTIPPYKYTGIAQTIRTIYHEEGPRGFYRGLVTNLIRVTPAAAVTLITYELLIDYLEQLNSPIPSANST